MGRKRMPARTLSQVVGTLTSIRQRDNDTGTELKKKIQNEDLTTGLNKTHTPLPDMDEDTAHRMLVNVQPDVYKAVALTVPAALKQAMEYAIPAIDAVATNDKTNQHANADVILPDGAILLKDAPVSHLLWLEKYLTEWRKFISVLPVLDPTKEWTPGDSNIYSQAHPEIRGSTAKKALVLPLHPGTDRHPPQAQVIEDTVATGHYTTIALSGAIYPSRKRELLDRFDMVINAVKDAAARANHTPAVEVKEGEELLKFLLS
jgi:hypothetical protein